MSHPNRSLRRVGEILRREYLVRVRNKWFLVTTFGFPLLMLGLALLPALLSEGVLGSDGPARIGVVDRIGLAWEGTSPIIRGSDSLHMEPVEVDPDLDPVRLRAELERLALDGLLVLEPRAGRESRSEERTGSEGASGGGEAGEGEAGEGEAGEGEAGGGAVASFEARLLTVGSLSQSKERTVRNVVRRAVVRYGLVRMGMPEEATEEVLASANLGVPVVRLGEGNATSRAVATVLTLLVTFVLYMMFLVYGQMIARGVLEEKSSDIAEVLVSAVRPWELMAGKILGIGAMGLTQLAIWLVTLALLALFGMGAVTAVMSEAGLDLAALEFPFLRVGAAFLLFFLLGYFLYASLFAAVGAMVGDEQEVQQVAFFPMLLIIVPFMIALTSLESPGSTLLAHGSLFPFFSPILMPVRVVWDLASAWEVGLSVVLLLVTTAGTAWLAGRIYRVGVLMKGKRPNLPELVRWVRHG